MSQDHPLRIAGAAGELGDPDVRTEPGEENAAGVQEGCDLCRHPLFAGVKCKNCGRVVGVAPTTKAHQECVACITPLGCGKDHPCLHPNSPRAGVAPPHGCPSSIAPCTYPNCGHYPAGVGASALGACDAAQQGDKQ